VQLLWEQATRDPAIKGLISKIESILPDVAGVSHDLRALRCLLELQLVDARALRSKFPATYLQVRIPRGLQE